MAGTRGMDAFSYSSSNLQRGGACSNCRRRKIKCDGVRSGCNQCRERPPRSGTPCLFDLDAGPAHQTGVQMQETIRVLKLRINELEEAAGRSGPRVLLQQPYSHPTSNPAEMSRTAMRSSLSPESVSGFLALQEPTPDIIQKLLNTFLDRFTNTGYFFLQAVPFFNSALLPLPFGHFDRPSQTLLNVVYLWGSVLSSTATNIPYTDDTFLIGALQSLPDDIRHFHLHPGLVLETIQAEVLLSLYYLHAALPVQGRQHSASAVSLALSAALNRSAPVASSNPALNFPLTQDLLPAPMDAGQEAERINAFWAVVMVDNCWVAAQGNPSALPYGSTLDTPWSFASKGGATITRFLSGDDQEGHSPVTLMVKASILLERVIAFSARNTGAVDATSLNSLDKRLHTFRASLPHASGVGALFMAHAMTDLAIVRLYSPLARSGSTSRYKCLTAANQLCASMTTALSSALPHVPDPILGPLCATVSMVYLNEMAALKMGGGDAQARAQYQEIDERAVSLMNTMGSLATTSPLMQRCLLSTRQAYGSLGNGR
ncbi:hypothetical protein B0H11DRAFT_2037155 [Mycena galericulata]|nr:hypothetical protein B0H11DRAFT_2037155 [Mycena galericulata]